MDRRPFIPSMNDAAMVDILGKIVDNWVFGIVLIIEEFFVN